ncbi:hypothetical protein CDAR_555251 [Caerostris darwini]|uniref:Uncharacterized protein n=1 Tax=Caerostris darwini TaxID=1538125 RepID=A0AAV4RFD5_9ARAC|nr:hypothetical protein CDAR_555251 [Caerostris darwini]
MFNHISKFKSVKNLYYKSVLLLRHASTPASRNRGVPHVFGELTDLSSFRDAAEGIDMAGLTASLSSSTSFLFAPRPFNITPSS